MPRSYVPVFVVDAFSPIPFTGNPAGVVVFDERSLEGSAPEAWMQSVAAEMRHAETAFVTRRAGGAGESGGGESAGGAWHYDLRWFTPEAEVDLCGHATLGSAHLIYERHADAPLSLVFHTRSGELTCRRVVGHASRIEMDFPSLPVEKVVAPEGLLRALGISRAVFVGKSTFDYFVELRTEREVRDLRPNQLHLAQIETRGVIVAARGTNPGSESPGMYDVISRFFAPRFGVPEDPVTGSAHCVLAPYYSALLGKASLTCYQASARGGIVNTEHRGARTVLSGEAVTMLEGRVLGWK